MNLFTPALLAALYIEWLKTIYCPYSPTAEVAHEPRQL